MHVKPIHWNLKEIVQDYKERAKERRLNDVVNADGKMTTRPRVKVTEILTKSQHNEYTCPKCRKSFKPQGITNHVKSCAEDWCKKNGIMD